MLLSEQGIGEGKAAGDTSLVEFIENVGNGTLIGIAVDISSAVPYSGGGSSRKRKLSPHRHGNTRGAPLSYQ